VGVVTTTTGGTRVLEKVFYTSVLVSDQGTALDFYTNILGLEKRVENPAPDGLRFLTVGVKEDDFQLVLWPGTPGQAELTMGRPPASITIETDDCRKTVEELKSRGVEFVSDVLEFPWGYVAQFQDPDGNRLSAGAGARGSGSYRQECLNGTGIGEHRRASAPFTGGRRPCECAANRRLLSPNSVGASVDRTQEVGGSSPPSSIVTKPLLMRGFVSQA